MAEYYKVLGELVGAAAQLACMGATHIQMVDEDGYKTVQRTLELVDRHLDVCKDQLAAALRQSAASKPEPSE